MSSNEKTVFNSKSSPTVSSNYCFRIISHQFVNNIQKTKGTRKYTFSNELKPAFDVWQCHNLQVISYKYILITEESNANGIAAWKCCHFSNGFLTLWAENHSRKDSYFNTVIYFYELTQDHTPWRSQNLLEIGTLYLFYVHQGIMAVENLKLEHLKCHNIYCQTFFLQPWFSDYKLHLEQLK